MRRIAGSMLPGALLALPAVAQMMPAKLGAQASHPHPPQMSANAFSLTNGLAQQRQFLIVTDAKATAGTPLTIAPGKSQTYRCPLGASCWVRFAGERGNKTRQVFVRRAYQLAWHGSTLDLWDLTGGGE